MQILNTSEFLTLKWLVGTSLVVQWLRLQASNAEDVGSIPSQGTKIPHSGATKSHAATTEPPCPGACMLQMRPDTAK